MTEKNRVFIGIDLGTTNTVVSMKEEMSKEYNVIENEEGDRITPSVVCFRDDEVVTGKEAKNRIYSEPERVVYGSKRLIGRKKGDKDVESLFKNALFKIEYDKNENPIISIPNESSPGERTYRPEEISAQIIKKCIDMVKLKTGKVPDRCFITVPAYFNHPQRQATERAAQIAGISKVSIANEPTAAAIAYQHKKDLKKGTVLVFDFGGGTLDISIVEVDGNKFTVKAVAGDTSLGGEDIDALIVDEMIKRFKEKNPELSQNINKRSIAILKEKCEEAKHFLSSSITAPIVIPSFCCGKDLNEKLNRAQLEKLCKPLFDKITAPIETALNDAKLTKENIDAVIAVGGSSKIPAVKEIISDYFGDAYVQIDDDFSSDGVAVGASIICQNEALIEDGKSGIKFTDVSPFDIVDVVPISVGIKYGENRFQKYINRNQSIPTSQQFQFNTMQNYQDHADIEIFQGEAPVITKESHVKIGQFTLKGIPRRRKGEIIITVTILANENGIIKVTASCNGIDGIQQELEINYKEVIEKEEFDEIVKRQEEIASNMNKLNECDDMLDDIQCMIKKLARRGKDMKRWQIAHDNFNQSKPSKTELINRYYEQIKRTLEELKKISM